MNIECKHPLALASSKVHELVQMSYITDIDPVFVYFIIREYVVVMAKLLLLPIFSIGFPIVMVIHQGKEGTSWDVSIAC